MKKNKQQRYPEGKVKLQGIRPMPKTEKPDMIPYPQKKGRDVLK